MKYLCILLTVLCIMACNSKPERPAPILDPNYQPAETTTPATTPEPAQNAAGVWHYTCENGCAGGAGSAQACATCGSTLKHNKEYHSTGAATASTPTIPVTNPTNTNATTPELGLSPTALPKPKEPAQNAAGVWHYTCGNGCAGGAGSAIACNFCGSTLKHNQAYHQ